MFECNAFNLNNQNGLELVDEVKPMNQIFINLNYMPNDEEIYLTPPASVNDINQMIIETNCNYTPPRRPNRPYSYYIATNFHPLDLSLINDKINEINTNDTTVPIQQQQQREKSPFKLNKITKRNKKEKDLSKKSKRLSTSLGNLVDDETNLNLSCNTTQNTPLNKKKIKSKNKDFILVDEFANEDCSNHFLHRRPGQLLLHSEATTTNKKSNLYSSTRRLNKFIRNIFHLDSDSVTATTIKTEPTINSEPNKLTSKFSRFFSSFRPTSNHNQSNKKRIFDTKPVEETKQVDLVIIDEHQSNQMLPEIKLATPLSLTTKDLELNFKKELNYNEIAFRLKKLTATSCTSGFSSKSDTTGYESASTETLSKKNEKSTWNISTPMSSPISVMSSSFSSLNQAKSSSCFMDIPFIDEDLESNYDLNLDYDVKTNLGSASTASQSSSSSATDCNLITNQIVKEYLRFVSYDRLDIIVNEYFKCFESEWLTIVLVFELTNKSIQILNESTDKNKINQLKDLCAKYINDKYCEFIHQNGGWDSVPDSLTFIQNEIKNRSNERIH